MRFAIFTVLAAVAGNMISSAAIATVTFDPNPGTFSSESIGLTVRRNFNGFINEVQQPGLSSRIEFTLLSIGNWGRRWTFQAEVTNTSGSQFTSARLSHFGFATDNPLLAGINVLTLAGSGGVTVRNLSPAAEFTEAVYVSSGTTNVPQLGSVAQVCIKGGGGGNCGSGGGGGLAKGLSETLTFALNFQNPPTVVSLLNFVARYQSLDGTGPNARGEIVTFTGASAAGFGEPIPEPANWAMLIAGFGLIGAISRRQRQIMA